MGKEPSAAKCQAKLFHAASITEKNEYRGVTCIKLLASSCVDLP